MQETKINFLQAVHTANTVVALLHLLLLLVPSKTKATESSTMSRPGCPDNCGGIPIPYPFGFYDRPNCYLSDAFKISCNATTYSGKSTFTPYWLGRQVLDISLSLGEARLSTPISSQCYNTTTKINDYSRWKWNLTSLPYRFNHEKNKIVVIGCSTLAYVQYSINQNTYWGACGSWCYRSETLTNGSCSGIGCSQTVIPKGTNYILFSFEEKYNNSRIYNFSQCGYAMVMEADTFTFKSDYITTDDALERENITTTRSFLDGLVSSCNHVLTTANFLSCTLALTSLDK